MFRHFQVAGHQSLVAARYVRAGGQRQILVAVNLALRPCFSEDACPLRSS